MTARLFQFPTPRPIGRRQFAEPYVPASLALAVSGPDAVFAGPDPVSVRLDFLRRRGCMKDLTRVARRMAVLAKPAGARWLRDWLSTLGTDFEVANTVVGAVEWLQFYSASLCLFQEDILALAIDEAVQAFEGLPTVDQIRQLAEPAAAERWRRASMLKVLQDRARRSRPRSASCQPMDDRQPGLPGSASPQSHRRRGPV